MFEVLRRGLAHVLNPGYYRGIGHKIYQRSRCAAVQGTVRENTFHNRPFEIGLLWNIMWGAMLALL